MLRAAASSLWRQLPRALSSPAAPAVARSRQLVTAPVCCAPPPAATTAKPPAIPPVKRITRGVSPALLQKVSGISLLHLHRSCPAVILTTSCTIHRPACPRLADDVEIQFARSSGAGGQNVNKARDACPGDLAHARRHAAGAAYASPAVCQPAALPMARRPALSSPHLERLPPLRVPASPDAGEHQGGHAPPPGCGLLA